MARGDRASRRLRRRDRESTRGGDGQTGHRCRADRRRACHHDRRPPGPAAAWHTPGRGRRHRDQGGRACAPHRPLRFREVDAVPRHCRDLAVRHRHRHGAQGRQGDGAAAAALLPDRDAGRRDRLSGGCQGVQPGSAGGDPPGGRAWRAGRAARRGGALEPHAVAGRAAAARHRARHPAGAGLSAARRGHRISGRAG